MQISLTSNYVLGFSEIPVDLKQSVFEFLNPKELALSSMVCREWRETVSNIILNSPTVQTATLLLLRKVLAVASPIIIKAPYFSRPVMDVYKQKIVYNTQNEIGIDKKFVAYDIDTQSKHECLSPRHARPINFNLLKLHDEQVVLGDSVTLSVFDMNKKESEEKEKETVEKEPSNLVQLRYHATGGGRHAYNENTHVAAGMGFYDSAIIIHRPGKALSRIPFDNVPNYEGDYQRESVTLQTKTVTAAFRYADSSDVSPNITYVDTYSLETETLINRVPFVNEKMISPSQMISNEHRVAIAFSSGRVALINALDGKTIQSSLPINWNDVLEKSRKVTCLYMDNQRLVIALATGAISIWNPITGALIRTLDRSKPNPVKDLMAYQNILGVVESKSIEFWEMDSGEKLGSRQMDDDILTARLKWDGQVSSFICRVKSRNNFKPNPTDGDIMVWQSSNAIQEKDSKISINVDQ